MGAMLFKAAAIRLTSIAPMGRSYTGIFYTWALLKWHRPAALPTLPR